MVQEIMAMTWFSMDSSAQSSICILKYFGI